MWFNRSPYPSENQEKSVTAVHSIWSSNPSILSPRCISALPPVRFNVRKQSLGQCKPKIKVKNLDFFLARSMLNFTGRVTKQRGESRKSIQLLFPTPSIRETTFLFLERHRRRLFKADATFDGQSALIAFWWAPIFRETARGVEWTGETNRTHLLQL